MPAVKIADLLDAFEFVSFGPPCQHEASLSLADGRFFLSSDGEPLDDELDEEPESLEGFLQIPHKYDLDLGTDLVMKFAAHELPDHYDQIVGIFRHKGAYRRFKDLLDSLGALERWYTYEKEATERALREWAAANELELIEGE